MPLFSKYNREQMIGEASLFASILDFELVENLWWCSLLYGVLISIMRDSDVRLSKRYTRLSSKT